MLVHAATGFAAGLALIIAIGAQNAFILRQGLLRQHVLPLVLFCACADALLIVFGVAGLGQLIESQPTALTVIRYGGAAFLGMYGWQAIRRVAHNYVMAVATGPAISLFKAIATVAGFTFLNPHVYLDTVVLLGALANQSGDLPNNSHWYFALGAVLASFVWFFSLGYGARLLVPLFQKPMAWRILDGLIALVMISLALSLLIYK